MLRLLLYCCLAVVFAKEEFEVSYSSGEKAVDPFFDANQAVVHKRNVGFAPCQDEGGTVNGLTCLQIFQATGIKFCDHVDLSRKCCATRWRYCGDCKDTPNIRVNEMTCHDFFMKTGQTACHRGDVAGVCCASRRKVCDNCYGDTTNVLLGNMTCSELISKVGLAACHHHQVIQHCCLTRGVMCECNGDHLGTSFSDKDGNTFTCATIFSDNKFDVCRSPTVLQGCCKSFREHCKDSPILG
ncbi:uncharacterized protein LOC106159797 [Lingula anatina]|uniref:Uncharacterized protein LOC106159797 n=1 Tax=Lingula anatina TaxID=7574 RepID=A0A1S3I068_LINAN|nr:uncharacterized protein LOC106159797 [Lingula anatina]|eukprot:XP_013391653.1 uncharacterized protein LOC106159797 [Lingula anatina]